MADDKGQSDESLKCHYCSSSCSCWFWGSYCLFPSPSSLHCHLLTNHCRLPQSTYVWNGSPEFKRDARQEREPQSHPHLLFPLPLPFQYSYITIWDLQVFPMAQSLAVVLKQWHHCSFTFPETRPSCTTMACLYSVRSFTALDPCLIGIRSFMDRGICVQSFLPVVLWDLLKNNLSHFLESQLWNKFLTKMSTVEHLRRLW